MDISLVLSRLLPWESVPIDVYSEAHLKCHVFLCLLGYYIQWHLKHELAHLWFVDKHKDKAKEKWNTPAGKERVSDSAIKKQNSRRWSSCTQLQNPDARSGNLDVEWGKSAWKSWPSDSCNVSGNGDSKEGIRTYWYWS